MNLGSNVQLYAAIHPAIQPTNQSTSQTKQEGVAPNWITYGIVFRLLMAQARVAEVQALLTQVRIGCMYNSWCIVYLFCPIK